MSQTDVQPTATAAVQIDIVGATRRTIRAIIAGELDMSNSHIVQERLLAAIRNRHPTVLDVDMADVTFMDCSTVSALLRIHAAAEKSGCHMHVLNPRPIVARVLEVLGLLELLGTRTFARNNVVRVGEVATNNGRRTE